jgi:cell division septation protein DedD
LRAALKRPGYTTQPKLEEDELRLQQLRYASSVVNTPSSTRESTPAAVETNTPETATATSTPALEETTSDTKKESTPESSIENRDTKVDIGNFTNKNESPSEITNK